MTRSIDSRLARADTRPLLVSMLGGGWLLLSEFGVLRAIIGLLGLTTGVQIGVHDPMAELALHSPELLDPAWLEAQEQKRALVSMERTLALPLLAAAGLGISGAIRLLRRKSWSRAILLAAGPGAIGLTAAYAILATRIGMRPAADLSVPPDVVRLLYSVAGFNVLLQSLPVLVGMSLLRHPIVARFVSLPAERNGNQGP